MKEGQRYYFICHAYHHYVAEVVQIIGKKECIVKNCVKVHSCKRGWTEFLQDGFKKDTKYDVIPDGAELSGWMTLFPWKHTIPTTKADSSE